MTAAIDRNARTQRIKSKETVYFILIVAVIILYCLPIILIANVYLFSVPEHPLDVEDSTVKWFIAFAKGQQHSLDQVHRVLIPLITFIAAASFATASTAWRTLFLSLLILFFFFLALGMQVAFEAHLASQVAQVSPFFSRLEETLITYLMLILGLEAAKTESTVEEAAIEPPHQEPAATSPGRPADAE